MKRIVCVTALAALMGSAAPVWATNGYQLTGVGQMQKSMGGAVTAAPMDTMTAISNPAGMARVGQRADFSMEAFMPVRSVDFAALNAPGTLNTSTEGGSELYGIPSVGWVANAFGRDNYYFGGGMFATSGMGVDYEQITLQSAASSGLPNDITFNGYSSIAFWKMAPTLAWNQNDSTSIGLSLNVDYQSLTFREKLGQVPFWDAPPGPSTITQRDVNFDLGRPTSQLGVGFTVGVLRDIGDTVTVGFNYASKQEFGDGEFRVGAGDLAIFNGAVGLPGVYKLGVDYPQQAAVGVAVKPSNRVLVDLDVKWINWSATHDQVSLKGPANSFDTNGDGIGDASATQLAFGWDNQVIYALGVQFVATEDLKLRAGFNYGKSPIGREDVMNNLIFPAIAEKHLMIGADYQLGEHWGIGGTFMKAFKNSVTGVGDVPAGFQFGTPFMADSNMKISLEETSLGLLLDYKF
ncbi:MAG: outer membrane protein transport protein [Nitrospirota bacterium]|nr:outer membrane protein transport protein [Nitrospirota bacterium]